MKQVDFILYGAASLGGIARNALEKGGFHVAGYIDRRAYELREYKGLPVWSMDSVPDELRDHGTYIFISVKNVFEHEAIARMLDKKGFYNLIYKPYSVLMGYGNDGERELAALYDSLFAGECRGGFKMPDVDRAYWMHDFGRIQEENGMVTAYIPAEFLFSNAMEGQQSYGPWGKPQSLLSMFAHIDFFRFLSNHTDASPHDYLEEYCVVQGEGRYGVKVTEAWKENVMENRMQVYEEMRASADLDADFFIRNAAQAKWNRQGHYFNLISGKHRCTFQVALGKKYLPVKLAKEDYDAFWNACEIPKTMELLQGYGADAVIPHPAFYRGIQLRDRGEWEFLLWFARYYARKTYFSYGETCFPKLDIVDCSSDLGNFARFCVRLGCRVWRYSCGQLEQQLNRLFRETDVRYGIENAPQDGCIVILEADRLKGQEYGTLDAVQQLLTGCNVCILKYAEQGVAQEFAQRHFMRVAASINQKYKKGKILKSYIIERDCNEPDEK